MDRPYEQYAYWIIGELVAESKPREHLAYCLIRDENIFWFKVSTGFRIYNVTKYEKVRIKK